MLSVKYNMWQSLIDTVFYVPEHTDLFSFLGRILVFMLLFIWGMYFIFIDIETLGNTFSLMHSINLPFHEAGHLLFSPFGRLMHVLGGTLGQLLMPLIVMISFMIYQQDNFGSSVGLWWLAQSFMDCAPYINDARAGELILLGGTTGQETPEIHDWLNILGDLNLLAYDHFIAQLFDSIGILLMCLGFCWSMSLLILQYRQFDR